MFKKILLSLFAVIAFNQSLLAVACDCGGYAVEADREESCDIACQRRTNIG